jgi:hypothetical protein
MGRRYTCKEHRPHAPACSPAACAPGGACPRGLRRIVQRNSTMPTPCRVSRSWRSPCSALAVLPIACTSPPTLRVESADSPFALGLLHPMRNDSGPCPWRPTLSSLRGRMLAMRPSNAFPPGTLRTPESCARSRALPRPGFWSDPRADTPLPY